MTTTAHRDHISPAHRTVAHLLTIADHIEAGAPIPIAVKPDPFGGPTTIQVCPHEVEAWMTYLGLGVMAWERHDDREHGAAVGRGFQLITVRDVVEAGAA